MTDSEWDYFKFEALVDKNFFFSYLLTSNLRFIYRHQGVLIKPHTILHKSSYQVLISTYVHLSIPLIWQAVIWAYMQNWSNLLVNIFMCSLKIGLKFQSSFYSMGNLSNPFFLFVCWFVKMQEIMIGCYNSQALTGYFLSLLLFSPLLLPPPPPPPPQVV